MTPQTQPPAENGELRSEIEYIVAYTDNTPYSNEPTELITLLKQYDAEHVIDTIMALIDRHTQAAVAAALGKEKV